MKIPTTEYESMSLNLNGVEIEVLVNTNSSTDFIGSSICIIIENGKILVYTNYSTDLKDEGSISFTNNQFQPKFSIGPNGEMIPLRKGKLKKALKR